MTKKRSTRPPPLNYVTKIGYKIDVSKFLPFKIPTFLLANEGETGIIVEKKEEGHSYNYSVRTDHCQETFSVKTNEIEEIKEDNV